MQFLDIPLELGHTGLFILKLGHQLSDVLLPPLDAGLHLLLAPLHVGDHLVAGLKLALNPPLVLLGLALRSTLTLKAVVEVVQGLLQLVLDHVEVGNSVLGSLELLLRLAVVLLIKKTGCFS